MHHLIDVMGVSERFACPVTGQHRTTHKRVEIRDWLAANPPSESTSPRPPDRG